MNQNQCHNLCMKLLIPWEDNIKNSQIKSLRHWMVGQETQKVVLILFILVVIITWPEKFDFVVVPEHDVTGILT